ncbi:nitroreductase, partial [Streptomyces sp. E11-3]
MPRNDTPPAKLLRAALARARSTEEPGPDTPAGPAVPRWGGPIVMLRADGATGLVDLDQVLTRSLAATDTDGRLRPTPSAGALHPVNAHILAGPDCSVPPGRYAYDPVGHQLHERGPAPAGVPGGAVVVLTVTVRRTASHYAHRAWPMDLLDTGHAVAALLLAGADHYNLDADAALLSAAARLPAPGAAIEHPFAAVRFGPAAIGSWAAKPPTAPTAGPPPDPTPDPIATAYDIGEAERVLELIGTTGPARAKTTEGDTAGGARAAPTVTAGCRVPTGRAVGVSTYPPAGPRPTTNGGEGTWAR